MNESQTEFIATGGALSQTDLLINYLHRANNEWVPLPVLADVIGGFAVHSRASDARKRGVNVLNRVEVDKVTKKRLSWYKLDAP